MGGRSFAFVMNFDWIAPHYHWLELVFGGTTLQKCRTAWLDEVLTCREVLIIGEGDGRFLEAIARRLPQANFTCVDASPAMLALAAGRCPRAEFVCATMPAWDPPSKDYDLIVTHFFLDCLQSNDLALTVEKLGRLAKPGAFWLVADFQIPEKPGLANWRARILVATAYAFFRLTAGLKTSRIEPPGPLLEQHGFGCETRLTMSWGLLATEVWRRRYPGEL